MKRECSSCSPVPSWINALYSAFRLNCVLIFWCFFNVYNCSCDCLYSFYVVSFIVCVVLCAVLRLIAVLLCVMCVICLLCHIVLPLSPGKNAFAVKMNNNKNNKLCNERDLFAYFCR
jgi:hypothetical protein